MGDDCINFESSFNSRRRTESVALVYCRWMVSSPVILDMGLPVVFAADCDALMLTNPAVFLNYNSVGDCHANHSHPIA